MADNTADLALDFANRAFDFASRLSYSSFRFASCSCHTGSPIASFEPVNARGQCVDEACTRFLLMRKFVMPKKRAGYADPSSILLEA